MGEQNSLFRAFNGLSAWERDHFDRYLQGAVARRETVATKLWWAIKPCLEYRKSLKDNQVDSIFQAAFPSEVWSPVRWKNACHALMQHVKDFLVWQRLKGDSTRYLIIEMADALSRLPDDMADRHWTAADQSQQAISVWERDSNWFLIQEQLGLLLVEHRANSLARKRNRFLAEAIQRLDDRYQYERLRLECALLNQQQILGGESEQVHEVLAVHDQTHRPTDGPIDLYRDLKGMVLDGGAIGDYDGFTNKYLTQMGGLKPQVRIEILNYCLNWCIRGINQGQELAQDRYLALFEYSFSLGADSPLLASPGQCKNLVQIALRRGKMETASTAAKAAEKFGKAEDEYRRLIDALIAMYQWDLKTMGEKIKEPFAPKDRFVEFDLRVLRMLYGLAREQEVSEHAVNALRKTVQRDKKIAEAHRKRYLSFLSFIELLQEENLSSPKHCLQVLAELRSKPKWKKQMWILEWLVTRPKTL